MSNARLGSSTKAAGGSGIEVKIGHKIAVTGSVMIGSPEEIGVKETQPQPEEEHASRNPRTNKYEGV